MSGDEQLARTQLRSGFLSVLNSLKGRQVKLVEQLYKPTYLFLFCILNQLPLFGCGMCNLEIDQ